MQRPSSVSHVIEPLATSETEEPTGSLFLYEQRKEAREKGLHVIELDEAEVQNSELINPDLRQYLLEVFSGRIRENDDGLALSMINKHDLGHTRRVAAGVQRLGRILNMDETHLSAAVHGAELHDVGYHYPSDFVGSVRRGEMSPLNYGKKHQDDHPRLGAELMSGAVRTFKMERDEAGDLDAWNEEVMTTLNDTVLHHSNGSAYDPETVTDVAKLARLFDKLDNTDTRSTQLQIEMFRAAAEGHEPADIWHAVRNEVSDILGPRDAAQSNPQEEVRQRMAAVDEFYHHRLVPFAISDQFVTFNEETGDMDVHYATDPGRIAHKFGTDYSVEDHQADFELAYTKSMMRAAEIISSIRKRILGVSSSDRLINVHFHYTDGSKARQTYDAGTGLLSAHTNTDELSESTNEE